MAKVCLEFRVNVKDKCSYTVEDFLAILKHLLIVAPVTIDGKKLFFLPSILPTMKKIPPATGELAPLLLTCRTKVIPLGMFPALVVVLLDNLASLLFTLHESQYSNVVSLRCELGGVVLLVESHAWLEVRYNGSPSVASQIRVAFHKAIAIVCQQRQYDTEQVVFDDGFWCPFNPKCDNVPHPCEVTHATSWLTCSVKPGIGSGKCSDPRMLAWVTTPAGECIYPIRNKTLHYQSLYIIILGTLRVIVVHVVLNFMNSRSCTVYSWC